MENPSQSHSNPDNTSEEKSFKQKLLGRFGRSKKGDGQSYDREHETPQEETIDLTGAHDVKTASDNGEQLEIKFIEELAKRKNEAYADLINGPLFYGRKKRQEVYDEAAKEYEEGLKQQIETDIAGLDDESEIQERVNARLNELNRDQYETLIEKGGKRAKLAAKYSTLSTAKKIGIGVGLGVVGGIAGFAAGAAGASVAAVVGGLKIYGVSRSYFLGKAPIYQNPGESVFKFEVNENSNHSEIAQDAAKHYSRHNEEMLGSAEKNKKRALAIGLGAAALTGVAGAVGAAAHATDMFNANKLPGELKAGDRHWRGGYFEHINGPDVDIVPDQGDISPGNANVSPNIPDFTDHGNDSAFDAREYVENKVDMDLHKGEGGMSLAKHFEGVSQQEMAKAWPELGKELHEQGFTYWDDANAEWRISMTPDGKIPSGVAEHIANYFHSNDMLTSSEQLNHLPSVSEGQGLNQFVEQNYDTTLSSDQSLALGEALHEQGEMYSSNHLAANYGNPYGINNSGVVSEGMDTTIRDMIDNGQIDGSAKATEAVHGLSNEALNAEHIQVDGTTAVDGKTIPSEIYELGDPTTSVDQVDVRDVVGWVETGDVKALNELNPAVLDIIGKELSGYSYSDGTPVMSFKPVSGHYEFNFLPQGHSFLPEKTQMIIRSYLGKHNYTLAS